MNPADDIEQLKAQGQWLEAATLYATLVEADIHSAPVWVQLGHLLKEGQALGDAEYAYRSAIRADGTEPDPRLHLAHLLKRQGRLEEALAEFEALQALPNAVNVAQEVAGMRVALLPQNLQKRPISEAISSSSADVEPHRAAIQSLRSKQDQVEAEERQAFLASASSQAKHAVGSAGICRGACGRRLEARLVPKANLIISDDTFVATTSNPQFHMLFENELRPTGWIEVEFEIDGNFPLVEPILYVEHSPHWQDFSFHRLAPHNGRFRAVCFLQGPVLAMRLDPVQFEGPFHVTFFQVRKISLPGALRAAWRMDSRAARSAVSKWRKHKSATDVQKDVSSILRYGGIDAYQHWIRKHDTLTPEQIGVRERMSQRWLKPPRLTVLIPYDPRDKEASAQSLRSLSQQFYRHFQVQFITSASLPAGDEERMHALPASDLPSAIMDGKGDFFLMLEAGATLGPAATFAFAERIVAKPLTELLYGDEDCMENGRRCHPLFKPDWDPDFEAATGYLGNFVAISRDRLTKTLASCPSATPDWFELTVRSAYALDSDRIVHIPRILGHTDGSLPSVETTALTSEGRAVLAQAINAAGDSIEIAVGSSGVNRIIRPQPAEWPHVTLIIPTRDSAGLLRQCIQSLLSVTAYPSFDIMVVDNGSAEQETLAYFGELERQPNISVLPIPGPFNFSTLNNAAARQARGAVVGLVNNDVVAIQETWLTEMVVEAIRPEIGAVGAKLLYRSGHVQHAGMACGIGLVTGHPHKFRERGDPGYMMRLVAPHRVSAVTAACLIVEKRKYLEVGGLDEGLAVAFNDVDFCLKLGAAGYSNLFTPQAELIHLESVTRGLDTTPDKEKRYREEADAVLSRWSHAVKADPYYNINLTREREDYSYDA